MEQPDPQKFPGWGTPSSDYQPPPAPNTPQLPEAERTAALDQVVNQWIVQGWRVESRQPHQAVLVRGRPTNHVLHAILTIFTCLMWGIVWIIMAARGGEERTLLTVDGWGRVTTNRAATS
ncbi:hypothetical protein [Kitasatospora sp. NPDC057198]|uniref:hypothetical protein n=1 Tax=Kitasatospora sp. NPDC057198 TaxID=3346046 RepID=UPI00363CB70C